MKAIEALVRVSPQNKVAVLIENYEIFFTFLEVEAGWVICTRYRESMMINYLRHSPKKQILLVQTSLSCHAGHSE